MVSNFKIQGMPSLPSVEVSQFSTKTLVFPSFNFISSSIILHKFRASIPIKKLHSISLSSSPAPLSVSDNSSNEHSFEVSYLINTFGWPPKLAISKAKSLKFFKTSEKPDRVLAFFKRHKFTDSQISIVVKKHPRVLVCYPEKTLFPRFGFLSSLGLSMIEIADVVTRAPGILLGSVEELFIPNFNRVCDFACSYDEAVRIVKRTPLILCFYQKQLDTQILLEAGVPAKNIEIFMIDHWLLYKTRTCDSFGKMVEQVKEMGFDPCTRRFLEALRAMMVLGKSTWENEVQVFKKYGWSDHEISLAFKKFPDFILCSQDKAEGVMDFLVNTMGVEATTVANFPVIFKVSLEKRIIPRCLFYLSLLEKGLCHKEFSITFLTIHEAKFITRFIKRYENEAPELWDLYKGLMKLHRLSLSSPSPSPSPVSVYENSSNEHSFAVSYLMRRFGWPQELAVMKAKSLIFETPEKPERILSFLNNHGFTETQISLMVKIEPRLLRIVDPEKSFLPTFEFLSSIGLSRTEVTDVVTKAPKMLRRRLEKIIIPTFNLLCNLVNSDDEAVKVIKQHPNILYHYHEADNIQTLLNVGVPTANVVHFMKYFHNHFKPPTPDNFRKMVEEVKEMGFDPCTLKFLNALRVIKLTGKSTWEDKVQVLKKYGWSDRNILLALEKDPKFIRTSTNKIKGVMDFLVNEMGLEVSYICNWPLFFFCSLEKTIIPRSLVYRSLLEKGLLKRKGSLKNVLNISKAEFLSRFIKRYEDEAPELWDLYNGKLQNRT